MIGFIEYLQIVTTTIAPSLIHTHTSSLQHLLSLLSLLCLHQSLPGDRSKQCPLLACSRSYQLASHSQLTHSVGRLNSCRSSPAQSFLTSVSLRSMTKIFILSQICMYVFWNVASWHGLHRKHRSSVAGQLLLSVLHRKHRSSIVCGPLPSNGRHTVAA
jgi:hypothetical protein